MAIRDGDAGDNVLVGTNSADTISGFGGNDELSGLGGNDLLLGGAGNDLLDGGSGTNTLTGGTGIDTFAISARQSQFNTITDFEDGTDLIDLSAMGVSSFSQVLEYLTESAGDTYFRTEWADFSSGDNETLRINNIDIGDLSAADFIFETTTASQTINITSSGTSDVFGGLGDDDITGSTGNETINAGEGNDTINAGRGTNLIRSDIGADTIEISSRGTQFTTIADFEDGVDIIDISSWGVSSFSQLLHYITENSGDALISTEWADFSSGDNERLLLRDFDAGDLSAADFIFRTSTSGQTINVTSSGTSDVFGGLGDDDITGGTGNETINAGEGNDTINAGRGTNLIRSDIGADTIEISFRGSQSTTIADFEDGVDIIDLSDWGVSSFDQLQHYLSESAGDTTLSTEWADFSSGDNEELVFVDTNLSDLSADDFVFRTSTFAQTINITSSGTSDVFAGRGDDDITGSTGNETINAGEGDDIINAGRGTNLIRSEDGSDTIEISFRGAQSTTIADFVSGEDIIDLSDWFIGSFDQLLPFLSESNGDVLISTQWQNFSSNFNETLTIENTTISALSAADFDFNSSTSGRTLSNSSSGRTTLFGGLGDDEITGGSGRTTISGGDGDDVMNGGRGNDVLIGGVGSDEAFGGDDNDLILFQNASELSVGNEIIDGGDDFDRIEVSGADDNYDLRGSTIASIEGLTISEADALVQINAIQVGGGGLDDALAVVGDAAVGTVQSIEVFMASDSNLDISGWTFSEWNAEDTIDIIGDSSAETIIGSSVSDTINSSDGADTVEGGAGNDLLRGGAGNDDLDGGADSDRLEGGTGNDTLFGGTGGDILVGGSGNDTLDGWTGFDTVLYTGLSTGVTVDLALTTAQNTVGAGIDTLVRIENLIASGQNDTLLGTSNRNRVEGGAGDDTIDGRGGNDTLLGGSGNDVLTGGTGADRLIGGTGNDDLFGGTERDRLEGGSGNDDLFGGDGVDRLLGGDGNDLLVGGEGTDFLFGGAGADRFDYNSVDDSNVGPFNRDEIRDFNSAEGDKIDVLGIDADINIAGNQAFNLINGSFTGTAGEIMIQSLVRSGVDVQLVSFDVDGDARADMQLWVLTSELDADDFVL